MQQEQSSGGGRVTTRTWAIRGGLVALLAVIAAVAVIAVCQFPLGDDPEAEEDLAPRAAREDAREETPAAEAPSTLQPTGTAAPTATPMPMVATTFAPRRFCGG